MSSLAGLQFWKYLCLVLVVGAVLTVLFERYAVEFRYHYLTSIVPVEASEDKERVIIQTWKKVNAKLYIYSAYYDNRNHDASQFGGVQVMAFIQEQTHNMTMHCCLRYSNGDQLREDAKQTYKRVYNETHYVNERYFTPVVYSCRQPDARIPSSVSLTTERYCVEKGDTHSVIVANSLGLIHRHAEVEFGVCVHSPLFNMTDYEFVAGFIELNRMLGAEWFTFYIYSASESVRRLLSEYEADGVVEVASHWGENMPKVRYYGQDMSIHDCLYRNMNRVKYLFCIDLDEVIFPEYHSNWHDMMKGIDKGARTPAFTFLHVAMFRNPLDPKIKKWRRRYARCHRGDARDLLGVPRYLEYTIRSLRFNLNKGKLVVKPREIRSLAIHRVLEFWNIDSRTLTVGSDVASALHYRTYGLNKFSKRTSYYGRVQKLTPKLFSNLKSRLCRFRDKSMM